MAGLLEALNNLSNKDYKFLDKLNIKQINMPYIGKGYAETWPKKESRSLEMLLIK
jgi:hypothetical protein